MSKLTVRAVAFVLLIFTAACHGGSPTAPTEPSASRGIPTNIMVVGPTLVTTGEAVRYRAFALYSDNTRQDITDAVAWIPSDAHSSLYFTGPGIALGVRPGEVVVRASYPRTRAGSLAVLVLDSGTFALTGVVTESGVGPLAGATVEVTAGTGQGLRATTDANGRYTLVGVAGPLELRAFADGFAQQVLNVVVAGHGLRRTFALTPAEATTDVAGMWTMRIVPSPICRAGLPEIARGRPYQVELIQLATRLQLRMSGPTLTVNNPSWHAGTVLGSRVRLIFAGDTDYGEWSFPDIVDHPSSTELFGFDGTVDALVAGSEIRGTLDGDLVYFNRETAKSDPVWYCRARDHIVTLRR